YPAGSKVLLSLGVSALSFLPQGHLQNIKVLDQYLSLVTGNQQPLGARHLSTPLDRFKEEIFAKLSCEHEMTGPLWQELKDRPVVKTFLEQELMDDLIEQNAQSLKLKNLGVFFMKEFLSFFDQAIRRQ